MMGKPARDAPNCVWLIRHAQSHANAGLATEHPSSIALTALGHTQSAQLADKITHEPNWIVVSPFTRTLDTARPTLQKFAWQADDARLSVWPIQELTYLSPLKCKGTQASERQAWATDYWLRADPEWNDGNGAESFTQFIARIDAFKARLAQQAGFGLVFSHGMFLKAFLIAQAHGLDATAESMRRFRQLESAASLHNTQIIEWSYPSE